MTENNINDFQPETGTHLEETPPPPADPLGQRFVDLIIKPSRLMDNVGRAPFWVLPMVIIIGVMAIFTYFTMAISGPEQMELMRDSKIMQMAGEGAWEKAYQDSLNPSSTKLLMTSVFSGLQIGVMMLLLALILGFFAKMGGGKGRIVQALGIVSWASLIPLALSSLIKLPLILQTESFYGTTLGLAALIPDGDPSSPLYQVLLTFGDFFTWWGLALLVIGFERVYSMSRGAALAAVLLPWGLLSGIMVGVGILAM